MAKKHLPPDWSILYNREAEDYEQLKLALPAGAIKQYRCKIIKSGELVEFEMYPIWHTRADELRAKRTAKTRQSQQAVNDRNARKTLIRKINTNFGSGDHWITLTFDNHNHPADWDDAKRYWNNYIKCIQRRCKKRALPSPKYVYIIEQGAKTGRYHIHAILEGLLTMDEAEGLWRYGRRNNVRRVDADQQGGLAGLANYLTKAPAGRRRWGSSKGLKEPTVRIGRISKAKALRMASSYFDAAGIIAALPQVQRLCPGGQLIHMDKPKISDYVSGVYIYAQIGPGPKKHKQTEDTT